MNFEFLSRLNQFSPIFCGFNAVYRNGWRKIGKKFEISSRNFNEFANFESPIEINQVKTTKLLGITDLNKRKLNFHCEFAPNVGHLFFAFYKFFEILAIFHI